jgi:hypothetical protein
MRDAEVVIESGAALLWRGPREGWVPCSIDEAAENFVYVWEETYEGSTIRIFRHLKTAKRYGQLVDASAAASPAKRDESSSPTATPRTTRE